MANSHRSTAKTLWHIIFEFQGSIWMSVLPYCILNCAIMIGVVLLTLAHIRIAFSPSGHGLMTLIISFLVISKVNMAYDRYMSCRDSCEHAFAALRGLHQTALVFATMTVTSPLLKVPNPVITANGDEDDNMSWMDLTGSKIIDLLDCTVRVIKDGQHADYLARNEQEDDSTNYVAAILPEKDQDPMLHVEALRVHLYSKTKDNLELLERNKLMDQLNEFVHHYRNLLKFASTPLPFPLIQMGRTFLFIWTFTIPLVLQGVVSEWYTAMVFVFFLTYGFIGLELVAMKLVDPFGDGVNDLNVTGMREATVIGMEKDQRLIAPSSNGFSIRDKRLEYRRQKPRPPKIGGDDEKKDNIDSNGPDYGDNTSAHNVYHAISEPPILHQESNSHP